jgi:hypothetical protein
LDRYPWSGAFQDDIATRLLKIGTCVRAGVGRP